LSEKTGKHTLAAGRRELKELVETCDAIADRKFNPFFLDVKLGVETLRQFFPLWKTFQDHCMDAHTLNRLSEVVRLQNTQLKFQSSALYADPEFIARKIERMSEKRLVEVLLHSWHPLAELEQLTEETVSDALNYWDTLLPIAERWKKRQFVEGKPPSLTNAEALTGLGIHGEEFNKQITRVYEELWNSCGTSKFTNYWAFVRRSNYQETVRRAYFVSFLITYGFAKLQTDDGNLTLVPIEQPTGKAAPNSVSFPIPIPRSIEDAE
jgi:hypothetical protein